MSCCMRLPSDNLDRYLNESRSFMHVNFVETVAGLLSSNVIQVLSRHSVTLILDLFSELVWCTCWKSKSRKLFFLAKIK